jgi:hypothetical protein
VGLVGIGWVGLSWVGLGWLGWVGYGLARRIDARTVRLDRCVSEYGPAKSSAPLSARAGRKSSKRAVYKRPVHPYRNATQNRFTIENAKGA